MERATHKAIEESSVFGLFKGVAAGCWNLVATWPQFERDTIGRQLVRAADSVGANLVEGDGRYSDTDTLRFFVIARASARETRYWLCLATERGMVPEAESAELLGRLDRASKELNGLIAYRRRTALPANVRELPVDYGDPTCGPTTQ